MYNIINTLNKVLKVMIMNKLKEWLMKLLNFLDDLTYFIPDIFLILAVLSLVDGDLFHSILYAIVYLATSYGEYMYFKVKVARELMIRDIVKTVDNLVKDINSKELVTLDGLLLFVSAFDERLNLLERIIKEKEIFKSEMGKEE
jgi:hypothetical protein